MFGYLVSRERSKDFNDALKEKDIWFSKVGSFNNESFIQHCQAAANVELQFLIVDADCTDATSLLKGLRIFRASRTARIILVAPGRQPGDPTITSMLPLQIWDIVAPDLKEDDEEEEADNESEEVEEEGYIEAEPDGLSFLSLLIMQQISTELSYGNAARWDVGKEEQAKPQSNPSKEKKERVQKDSVDQSKVDPSIIEYIENIDIPERPKSIVKEVLVYQDRIIGAIFISVAGTMSRTGTTFTALQLSLYLSKSKKVALIHLGNGSRSIFEQFKTNEDEKNEFFMIENLFCYPGGTAETITSVLMQGFDYVVLDMGALVDFSIKNTAKPSDYLKEFARSDVHVITMGSSVDDEENALLLLDYLFSKEWERKLQFLVNFTTNNSFNRISQLFGKKQKNELKIEFHQNPIFDEPTHFNEKLLEGLLQTVLPKKKKKFKLF